MKSNKSNFIFFASALLGGLCLAGYAYANGSVAASPADKMSSFECYRYVDGKPTGTWINIEATSKSEAESKALARFKELGGRVDSANCHYK
jgi:hypothetical protein